MKILKYIILSIVASLGLWSCYDDKGNYDYHDLDEIVIDSSGGLIQANYSISRLEILEIPLKVYYEGKLVNGSETQFPDLEFNWVVYQQGTETPIADRDTIAKQIELKIPRGFG